MATVVDALVVNLGLDPKAFLKGSQQATAALAKTREGAVREGRQIERSLDSAGESIERLARNALKLFAIFTGGRAIGTFVTDIGRADAAMGRMADRLGVMPSQIAAFDNAVKRIGGSAGEGAASFQRLSDTINELRTTGNSSALPAFAKLQGISGQQIRLNAKLEESFGDLAEAAKGTAERAGASTASFLLRQAGYSEATINLLLQGRAAVEKALSKSARSGLVTKADADAARALGEQYEDLSDKIADFGRKISTALTPVLVDLMKRFGEWVDQNKEWLKTEIVGRVEEFAKALREIPWDDVGKGIKSFISAVNDAAQSMGGWKTVAEIFFGLWAASKVAAVLAQIGLIRAALVVGDTSLLAAMARVGLPVAIGAAAMGHGFQTPEQAAKDPEQAELQREGIERRGRVREWIGRQYRRFFGGGSAEASDGRGGEGIRRRARRSERATDEGRLNARAPEGAGKYRPEYKLSDADLSQRTADIIAGEAIRKNPESIDAVINNMMNRVGSKGWGPSGNLEQVATAPGQYEAAWRGAKASPSETEFIRSRIKAIASGGVPDSTNGANSYRAESYFRGAGRNKTWARTLGVNGTVVGGNRYTYDPSASNGPYAPYAKPKDVPDPQREKDLEAIRNATSGGRKPDVLADPKDERRQQSGAGGTLAERAAAGYEYGPQTPYPNGRSLKQMNDDFWKGQGGDRPTDWKKDPSTGNWKPVFGNAKPLSSLLYGNTPPAARANAASVVSQTQSAQFDRMASISNDNRASSTTSNEAHFHGDMVFQNAGDSREIASNLRARLKEPQFVQAVNYGQA